MYLSPRLNSLIPGGMFVQSPPLECRSRRAPIMVKTVTVAPRTCRTAIVWPHW